MDQQIIGKLVCSLLSPDDNIKLSALNEINTNNHWHDVYEFTQRHKLISLLYFELNKYKSKTNIPSTLFEEMHRLSSTTITRSLSLSADTKQLLELLKKNNIDVMPLKGVYLAKKFYDSPYLRPMGDIDILVRETDIDKVSILLPQNGYTFIEEEEYAVRLHLPRIKTRNQNFIEIHWFLSPNPQRSVDENIVWETAKKENLYDLEIYAMAPEYLIIYLSCKLVTDAFSRKLLQLYDIALILSKSSIDWDILINTATKWKVKKEVLCILMAAQNLYHVNIPSPILKSFGIKDLTPDKIKYIESQFLKSDIKTFNAVDQFLSKGNPIEQIKRIIWLIFLRANTFGSNIRHKIKLIFVQITRFIYRFNKNKKFYLNILFRYKFYKKTLDDHSKKESFEKWLRK